MAVAGERLDKAMVESGVESPALADFLGTDRQTVGRWRRGERQPEGRFAAWLPLLVGSTPWSLFGRPPGLSAGPGATDPVPDGTTLASVALRPPGVILALQRRASDGVGGEAAALAGEITAMLHRALARAIEQTFAGDEAERTRRGQLAIADALEKFADDLHDNAGVDVHDITRVVRALRKGLLT